MLHELITKYFGMFATYRYGLSVRYPAVFNLRRVSQFVIFTLSWVFLTMAGCDQDQANNYSTTKTAVGIAPPRVIQAANLPQFCIDSLAASIEIDGNGSFSMEKRDDGLFYYYTEVLTSGLQHQLMIEFSCDVPNSTTSVSLATADKKVTITDGQDTIQLENRDFSIFPDDDTDGVSNLLELKNGTNPRHFIQRVSVDSAGNEAIGGISIASNISADGQYVVFSSFATNLVADDTNGFTDTFIHDIQAKMTTRVSVDSAGNEAIGNDDFDLALSTSADGRYVAFFSNATNLVSGDTNGVRDIFMHDTQAKTTVRISVDSAGNQVTGINAGSSSPSISADGRVVVFSSFAATLVAGDNNGMNDIFRVVLSSP